MKRQEDKQADETIEESQTLKCTNELAIYTNQAKLVKEREGEINDRLRLVLEDHDIVSRNLKSQITKEVEQIAKMKSEIKK